MECIYADLQKFKEVITEKDKEIARLFREIHKLKSVLERSELKRLPSISSSHGLSFHHTKKCGVSGESWEESESPGGLNKPEPYQKDFRTRQLLRMAIGENDFLKNLDVEQIRDIVDFMFPQTYSPASYIIREGEAGCHLYVSAEGQVEVLQDDIFLGTLGPGKAFGELALLYNCKRTASVRAIGDCKVWALERRVFQQVMVKVGMRKMEDRLAFLNSVPLLSGLQPMLLSRIADHLEVVNFQGGTYIIREGAVGDTFFIISHGRVQVTVSKAEPGSTLSTKSQHSITSDPKDDVLVLRDLGYGDYFGEQALLKEERRSANVVAMSPGCECLTLDRESFLQLIGDLSEFQQKKSNKEDTLKSQCASTTNGSASSIIVPHTDKVTSEESKTTISKFANLEGVILNLKLDDLEVVATLGVGGFGRVELVEVGRVPNVVFALKCLPKAHILATQQKEHVVAERNIMASCNSPFIVRLYKTFKDTKCIYLLMEACLGGEIWTVLRDKSSFDEDMTRFTVGCVLLALEYLHSKNIIYRDLKPENLMISNNGYVKLVDFGFSKVIFSGQRTWTFCGTPEYVAPEVILNRGHDRAVDFWALGVLLFELLSGLPPWGPMSAEGASMDTTDPLVIYNHILKGIESVKFPRHMGRNSISLIRRLCRQCPGERLGVQNGVHDVISHRWFHGFDWERLRQCRMKPSIEPRLKSSKDTSHFDKFEMEIENMPDDTTGWDVDF